MSLWGDITSAIGSVFGGGNNTQASNNQNDPLKQKQNNQPVVNQKVNLPVPLQASGPLNLGARPVTPVFNNQPIDSNQAGLTAQPTVAGTINLAPQTVTSSPTQPTPAPQSQHQQH